MVPLFIDHDVTDVIVHGIIEHFDEVDLVRALDVRLGDAHDNALLEWAALHGRVCVSSDANTMVAAAGERIQKGLTMLGLVVVRQSIQYESLSRISRRSHSAVTSTNGRTPSRTCHS